MSIVAPTPKSVNRGPLLPLDYARRADSRFLRFAVRLLKRAQSFGNLRADGGTIHPWAFISRDEYDSLRDYYTTETGEELRQWSRFRLHGAYVCCRQFCGMTRYSVVLDEVDEVEPSTPAPAPAVAEATDIAKDEAVSQRGRISPEQRKLMRFGKRPARRRRFSA